MFILVFPIRALCILSSLCIKIQISDTHSNSECGELEGSVAQTS